MATDQEIRDKGFKYIPPQKYLQSPFELPENQEPVVNEGIVNTNAFTNSVGSEGDNFSVYNPDPNSIVNKIYQPNYAYRQFVDGYDPNLSATANMKIMESDPNYKGPDYYNKPTLEGIPGALQNYVQGSLPGQFLTKATGFVNSILPLQRRSIMENQLSGQGIMVNDIGQIVQGQGDYNTAQNIMAGYAGTVGVDAVNKRQNTIEDTLRDKYNMSETDIDAVKAGTYKGPVESDLIGRYSALDEFKEIKGLVDDETDAIFDFKKKQKKKKKKKNIIERLFLNKKTDDTTTTDDTTDDTTDGTITSNDGVAFNYDPTTTGTASSNEYGTYTQSVSPSQAAINQDLGRTGGRFDSPSSSESKDTSKGGLGSAGFGGMFHAADGGRAGYFYGGRIGFQGGGSDASSDNFVTSTNVPGPGDTGGEGGYNPSDDSDTQFNDNDNNNENNNPPVTVVNNKPVDISTVTKSLGDYNIPYGVEALLSNKGKFKAVLDAGDILDKNLGLDFTYDQGPYQIGFNADMEGNKNLGLSYNKGNLSAYANTNFNDPMFGVKYSKAFAYGGLASIL